MAEPKQPPEPDSDSAAEERKAFLLRLPPQLHDELRRWANQELRSLNGHLEYLLRQALESRDKRKP